MEDTIQSKKPWTFKVYSQFIQNTTHEMRKRGERLRKLSFEARCLYIYLSSFAGKNSPVPFPSINRIRFDTGWGVSTIKKYRRELETAGLLERKQTKKDGRYSSNLYILNDQAVRSIKDSSAKNQPAENQPAEIQTAKSKPPKKYQCNEEDTRPGKDRHEVPKTSRRSTVSPSAEPSVAASAEDAPSEQARAAAPGTPARDADAASKQPSPASKAQTFIQGYKRFGTAAGIPTSVTPRDRQALEDHFTDNPETIVRELLAIMLYAWIKTPQAGKDGTEPYWYCIYKSRRIGTLMKFLTEIQDELEWNGNEDLIEDIIDRAERRFFQRGVKLRS